MKGCFVRSLILIVLFCCILISGLLFSFFLGFSCSCDGRKEVIVAFEDKCILIRMVEQLESAGYQVSESFRVINGVRMKLSVEEMAAIRKILPVKFIEPEIGVQAVDYLYYPLNDLAFENVIQADPLEVPGWEDKLVRSPFLWISPVTGKGVIVGVIDTGINSKHPDLVGAVIGGYSAIGSSWEDDNGHGTAVSSRIGARKNGTGIVGVAYECNLYAIKVLDKFGRGSSFGVVRGYEHALGMGTISLVNMSLGSAVESLAMKTAMENLAAWQGLGTICAAGNENKTPLIYPANNNVALPVGAVNTEGKRASFSNYGEQLKLRGCSAPGEWVMSAWLDGWKRVSGTSIATPFVTGSMACLVEYKNPSRKELFAGGSLANTPDIYLGYGIINIEKSINLLSEAKAPGNP